MGLPFRILPAMFFFVFFCAVPAAFGVQAAAQETEIPGVTADLAYLRQGLGVLHLGIKLTNTTDKLVSAGKKYEFSSLLLVDEKAGKKNSILKDANGCFLAGPFSGYHYCAKDGGSWWPKIPPHSEVMLWANFNAVPAGTVLSVHSPLMFPFENIKVSEQTAPVSTVGSSVPPVKGTFVSADRSSGQLRVRLKLINPEQRKGGEDTEALQYESAYVLDPKSMRKYPVLKDPTGKYLASPMSDDTYGGRYWYSYVPPGGQTLMSLNFQPPPDSVKTVDLVLPGLEPFENITLSGESGAATAGIAVAGLSQSLEGALKDLGAQVTEKEIKVQLQSDLLFDFDKAEIKKEAEPALEKLATVLKSYPNAMVLIEGHTDSKGNDAYNRTLSENRAVNVSRYLLQKSGTPAQNVQTRGWGKTKPVAHNTKPDGSDDPEGRAKNRRVEITVNKQ
jgi:outer membrane protein OmpA-like peptidoglycan-associated protein